MALFLLFGLLLCPLCNGILLDKKQMPFVAGRGAWPSALSRAHGFFVFRSEAKILDQKKRAVQAQVFGREGHEKKGWSKEFINHVNRLCGCGGSIKPSATDLASVVPC